MQNINFKINKMIKKIIKFLKNIKKFLFSENKNVNFYSNPQMYQGLLVKDYFWKIENHSSHKINKKLDVYLYDLKKEELDYLDNNRNKIVDFIIIDEFTNPELFKDVSFMNGKKYAKLIY